MKIQCMLIFLLAILFASCDGNFGSIQIQGSSEYENNSQSESIVIVNGDTVRQEYNKSKQHGGGEVEVNINANSENDTIPSSKGKDIIPLKQRIECTEGGISGDEFETLKEQAQEELMDKAKLRHAKQLFNEKCISAAQVRDLTNLFTLDKYKLDFAKFAYGRTTDRINFGKVLSVFKFEKNGKLLMEFVNEQ